jgi:glycosidase
MLTAINQGFGWTEGVNKLMMTLAQDVLYQNPLLNCIFLDNHDLDRFVTMIGGDMKKYKMGMALLMTLRGIPQLYYGAEVFMANDDVTGDGKKRNDFPGGFPGDATNKFEAAGRNPQENEAFNYVRTLAHFRKQSKALALGNTVTYLPQDGVFVYLRKSGAETVMVVVNQQMESRSIQSSRFAADTKGFTIGKEVTSDVIVKLGDSWTIPGQTVWVLSLQ